MAMLNNQVVNPYEFPTFERVQSLHVQSPTMTKPSISTEQAHVQDTWAGSVVSRTKKGPARSAFFLRELDGVHPGETGIQWAELEVFAENFKDFKDHFDPFLDNLIKGENTIAAWSLECISYLVL